MSANRSSPDTAPQACVIGHPISHSRSPLIHGHWLAEHGLAGHYDRRDITPEALADFVATMAARGIVGCNVTLPHKEAAAALCHRLEPAAARLGAANTLWLEDGQVVGDNTDVEGFVANLDDRAPTWRETTRTALVLGAGGAARAVVLALADAGVPRILVANRTPERAHALAQAFSPSVAIQWEMAEAMFGEADLLVNTTSLGMAGQPPLAFDLERLPARAIVSDIVYVPLLTPVLAAARARNLAIVDGLGMLLHQAVPGFARWFGVRPTVTSALRALIEADIDAASRAARP